MQGNIEILQLIVDDCLSFHAVRPDQSTFDGRSDKLNTNHDKSPAISLHSHVITSRPPFWGRGREEGCCTAASPTTPPSMHEGVTHIVPRDGLDRYIGATAVRLAANDVTN